MGCLQTVNALQLPRALRHPDKRQHVPFLQRHLRTNRREQSLITLNVGQETIGQVAKPGILNSAPCQRTAFRDQHLDVVLTGIFPLGRHTGPVRQQKAADQQHKGHIENAKGRQPFFLHQTVHHQIGARADKRTSAAENRRITQR